MSVEAISWALNLAPVPADRGGQPSSACKFVLVGLANHAGPGGTAAPAGTSGRCGLTAAIRSYPEPSGGLGSCSPWFGHRDMARSARAVISGIDSPAIRVPRTAPRRSLRRGPSCT
jgi:hypothetical protein